MFWNRGLKEENESLKFCLNQQIKGMLSRIEKIEIKELRGEIIRGPHECDICGCLIAAGRQIKGKSEIREKPRKVAKGLWTKGPIDFVDSEMEKEEYIHTPYYCGRCAPKEEKRNDRE